MVLVAIIVLAAAGGLAAAALLARGVDKAGITLILGENFLRVLRKAEEAS